jgi:hypothetical protein
MYTCETHLARTVKLEILEVFLNFSSNSRFQWTSKAKHDVISCDISETFGALVWFPVTLLVVPISGNSWIDLCAHWSFGVAWRHRPAVVGVHVDACLRVYDRLDGVAGRTQIHLVSKQNIHLTDVCI